MRDKRRKGLRVLRRAIGLRQRRAILLAGIALSTAFIACSSIPARAAASGGAGGTGCLGTTPTASGGSGGTGYHGATGVNGSPATGLTCYGGGGGGGGGAAGGGAGGQGGSSFTGYAGGNGGSGGANGNGAGTSGITNSFALSGGAGGNGLNYSSTPTPGVGGSGGGGGGAGGYGAIVTGSGSSSNTSLITGGQGGKGGNGQNRNTYGYGGGGGGGGTGGTGVRFTGSGATFTNSGSAIGGAGGAGGTGFATGSNGAGGVGIIGANLSIINSGTISGGLGGDGVTRADAIQFLGGVNTLTLQNGSSIAGNIEIDSSGSITFNQSTAQAVGNAITGSGSIIQNGTGTLTLSGVNTYTGGTSVLGGTLQLSGSGTMGATSGVLTVNGAALDLGATSQTQDGGVTLISGTIQNGTLSSFGTFALQSGTVSAVLASGGAVNKSGAGTVTLAGANTYFGGTTISAGTLQISGSGTLGADSGATTISGGTLDLGGTMQIQEEGATLTGGAIQDGTFWSSSILALQAGTVSAALAGTSSLSKTTSGTVVLSGVNTYTGATTISAGTLALSGSGSIASSSNVTLATGGSFDISQATTGASITTLADSGPGQAGTVALGARQLVITNGSTTFSGVIEDGGIGGGTGGSLIIAGGTQTLAGINTYTGATTISAGTLALSGSGSIASSSNVTPATGGSFDISQTTTGASITTLADSGPGQAGTVALGARQLVITNGSTTFSGLIEDGGIGGGAGGSLILNGGAQTLAGANTYTGGTLVAGGSTVALSGSGSIADSITVTLVGGSRFDISGTNSGATIGALGGGSGTTVLLGTKTLTFGNVVSTTFAGSISGSGALIMQGTGLEILQGTNTYTGSTTVSAGTIELSGSGSIADSSGVSLTASGATFDIRNATSGATINDLNGVSGSIVALGAETLTLGTANSTTFAGTISGSGGTLVKQGGGTLTLSGTNTYTGSTTVSAGTLSISSDANLGNGGTISLAAGTTLAFTAGGTYAHSVTLAGNPTFDVASGQTVIYSGVIGDGASAGTLAKTDSGTLVLTGANIHTGGTTVSAGTLQISGSGTLGANSGSLTVLDGTLDLGGTTQIQNGGVTLNGGTIQNGTLSTSGVFTLLAGTASANLTGSGSAIISGAVTLSGMNTYTGGTTVSSGTLSVSASSYLGLVGTVTLDPGTTLSYNASNTYTHPTALTGVADLNVAAGVTAFQTGVISDGSSPGTLVKTGTGSLALTAANTYSGGTIISAGILQLGNGGTTGSILGNITDNAELDFDHADQITYSGSITGSGSVHLIANGIILTGSNSFTGGTVISHGALQIGNDGTTGSITGNVVDGDVISNVSLAFVRSDNYTFTGNISGLGEVDQDGFGTLTLTGSNTYSGRTVILDGTLAVAGDSNLGTGSVTIDNNGTLKFLSSATSTLTYGLAGGQINTNGFTVTLSGVLATPNGAVVTSATQQLNKTGAGTLILTGANTYAGATAVLAGTLSISADANLGSGGILELAAGTTLDYTAGGTYTHPITVAGDPTFDVATGQTVTETGVIADGSSAGEVMKTGSGTLVLTAANSYSGGTIVSAGTLELSGAGTLGAASGATTVSGGTLDLGGTTQTQNGGLTLTGGIIQNGTLSSSGNFTVQSGTINAVLTGSGSLTMSGTTTVMLFGANTYTGGTTVSSGTLLGTTTSLQGNIVNNASVSFGQSTNGTYAGVISGSGVVTIFGGGTVTFSGTNTYTGETTVSSSTVAVNSDANLGAGGGLVLNGGTLQYGAGFASARAILINPAGATFNTNGYNPTLSGVISGSGALTKAGSGTLVLAGTNTYGGGTIVQSGTIQVRSNSALGTGDVVIQAGGLNNTIQAGANNLTLPNQITLSSFTTIDTQANALTLGGAITGPNALLKIGTGTLTLTGTNSYGGGTLVEGGTLAINSDAALGAVSGFLTLGGSIPASNGTLQFSQSGVVLNAGRTVVLAGGSNDAVDTQSFTDTIASTIMSPGGLVKIGSGTLVLSAANSYSGGTNVSGGTLQISGSGTLGSTSGAITVSGGTLDLGGTMQTQNGGVTISGGIIQDGTLSSSGVFSLEGGTISAALAGTGMVVNSGLTVLTGNNTYTGATDVTSGTLTISSNGNIGSCGLNLSAGATLAFSAAGTYTHSITIAGAANLSTGAGLTVTQSGIVSDGSSAGTLVVTGSGTLVLTGANSYSGGTTVSGGTLQIAGSGTLGSASAGTTISGGTLDLGGTTQTQNGGLFLTSGTIQNGMISSSGIFTLKSGTVSAALAGTGYVRGFGSSVVTLNGPNTYAGGTNWSSGTLQISGLGTLGAGTGSVVITNATLDLGGTTQTQNGGVTVGAIFAVVTSGGQIQNVLLPGVIQNGTLSSSGTFSLSDGTVSAALAGTGAINKTASGALNDPNPGTVTLSGANSYTGGTTVSAGTLRLSGAGTLGAASGATTVSGGTLDLGGTTQTQNAGVTLSGGTIQNGTLSSSGTFTLQGGALSAILAGSGSAVISGPVTFASANSYTGSTTVSSVGTLQGTTATLPGNIADNGIVTFNQSSSGTYAGVLSGTGSLTITGGGTLTLTGANSYSGGTTVSAGGLIGTTATLQGNIANSGIVSFNQSGNGIYAGIISGSGGVAISSGGTITFNGASTYGGTTSVTAGTLEVGDAAHPGASLGTGVVNIASGAVLMGHGSIGGAVTNAGTVAPGGTIGTLTVASYTQASSGTLQVEVSPGGASKLNVTGAANLAGAVSVTYDSGNYAPQVFDILHAGSITGTFSAINGSAPAGFVESLTYSPSDVDLVLAPAIPSHGAIFAAVRTSALLRAQQANATILSHAAAGGNDPGEAIRNAVAFAPSGADAGSAGAGRSTGWIQGTGDFVNLAGSAGAPGFRSATGGIMGGIDRYTADGVLVGIAAGYARASLSQSGGGTGTIETPSIAVYGRLESYGWDLDATAGYAWDRFHILRPESFTNGTATSGHDGQELSGALQLHTSVVVDGVTLTPAVGVQYVHLLENGFTETGAGAFDATLLGRTSSSLQPLIGATATETITTDRGWLLIPEAHLFYSREMEDAVPSLVEIAGTPTTLAGDVPARDRLTVGGRITAKLSDRFAFFGEYDAIVPAGNLLQQSISLGLSYRF